jgi:hypothetical protein
MKDGQTFGQWLKWDFKTFDYLIINDKNGKHIYFEDSDGFWVKWEYDSQGKEIYYENSNEKIIDNRPPEIIEHNGRKYKLIP